MIPEIWSGGWHLSDISVVREMYPAYVKEVFPTLKISDIIKAVNDFVERIPSEVEMTTIICWHMARNPRADF